MVSLITGGAGFLGSHLAERLLARGDEVLLMDNLSTGSMENIRHLKKYDRMHYFLEPLENRQLLAELVDEADVIFHLAAAVGVKLIVESPVRTIETNVNGMQMVLEAACRKRKLVFTASTSEVTIRHRPEHRRQARHDCNADPQAKDIALASPGPFHAQRAGQPFGQIRKEDRGKHGNADGISAQQAHTQHD